MDKQQDKTPPQLGRWLLEHTCPLFLYEEVRGDLDELHRQRLNSNPVWKANLLYCWEALTSIRLKRLDKKIPSYEKAHFAMVGHYLKIGLRNIRKHKAYNFINIGGLAAGLAACLMIALYVQHELSYNTWMADSDQIYRIPMEISSEETTRKFAMISATVAPALEKDYPQVENTLRLLPQGTQLIRLPDDRIFYEEDIYNADPSFFDFFTLKMKEGDPASSLVRPNTVILSETIAERYFGSRSALGQTISIFNMPFEVTGVMEDTPENTHHNFNMLLSWSTLGEWVETWHLTMFYTYIKLPPDTDIAAFREEIGDLAYRYVADDLNEFKMGYRYLLQPITDIYLNADYRFEAKPSGSAASVYMFSIIAGLVLLIACLNFINLSTARSEIRAKEVGMRKVVGAHRASLVGQFMGEALLLSFLSLLAALLIFLIVLPWYNKLVGMAFSSAIILQQPIIIALLTVAVFVGLAAGFYPALVLSSFSPLNMFRTKRGRSGRASGLRKGLVVGQFTISVVLIAGTITVYKQLDFMLNKELGFRTEQMLALPIRGGFDFERQHDVIKSEFGNLAAVNGVTLSSSVPGTEASSYMMRINREENDMTQTMNHLFVDYDFAETYGLTIIAGRDFDQDYGNDLGQTFLINEAAVASFGWSSPEEALGEVLESGAGGFYGEIVGVFTNFHYQSVDHIVDPLVLNIRNQGIDLITLRLSTDDISGTIDQVEAGWSTLFPDKPFDYFFVDEVFNAQYSNFDRIGRILFTFSMLAIFIACLGLYGLAAFSAQQRTKEIGIRKVLGASIPSLTFTVSRNFLELVFFAVCIAIPLAWWLSGSWLEQFAYRFTPDLSIFLLAGLAATLIAVLTVSWQSIRAALINPVESLRSE